MKLGYFAIDSVIGLQLLNLFVVFSLMISKNVVNGHLHIINRKICVSVCLSDRDLSSSERKELLACRFLQKFI